MAGVPDLLNVTKQRSNYIPIRPWDLPDSAVTPERMYMRAIAGKGHWQIARWLLFPLAALQVARVTKTLLRKPARISASNQNVRHVVKKTITTIVPSDTSRTAMNNTPQGNRVNAC